MTGPRFRSLLSFTVLLLLAAGRSDGLSAGGGLNTLVVVNQSSSDSVELGNYYRERRGLPPGHLLRIRWNGPNTTWTRSEFDSVLLAPLRTALSDRQLAGQIRCVVLSMDIPFAVSESGAVNSTTSVLFYGFKAGTKNNENSFAGSEGAFGDVVPSTAPEESFLATMITAGSLDQARALVEQGIRSDATFPTQAVLLAKTTDPARNKRYTLFDNAVFNARLAGSAAVQRIDSNVVAGRSNLLGFQTGLASFNISPDTFIPGAMADSMTSFGGVIFGPNSQTSLLAFIHAGAAGSYGTVTEPGAVISKFPDPLVYFYQARGFSLAECYYMSVEYPYQGLIVAEPLAAPFARPGTGAWSGTASNEVLSGMTSLSVGFEAADARHPLQQVDLFVDGVFFQTLTNLPPAGGNRLELNFAGGTVDYAVPAGATLGSLATGLAAAINSMAASSPAHLSASAHGDRIELRSLSGDRPRPPSLLAVASTPPNPPPPPGPAALAGSSIGSAARLTTHLVSARESALESPATGVRSVIVSGLPQVGTWLRLDVTKVNGTPVTVGVTNQTDGVTLIELVGSLAAAVNAAPGFQAPDGLIVEDIAAASSAVSILNLRSRTAGYAAAGLRFQLTTSPGLTATVAADDLRENLADLLPRNHVLLRAGSHQLDLRFPLDTRLLDDGYHELTAVAYEGSHVRTQTRTALPVRIQNTTLTATLALDAADPAPGTGTYTVQVTANQPDITSIQLFTTGGPYDSVAGQSSASFALPGPELGVGRHPLHAIVETSSGERYRTETRWLRLTATP